MKDYLFGLNNGYKIRDTNKPQSEASATIVWEYLHKRNTYPLIWNAFPFHPHMENDTESNRKPNIYELKIGKNILEELINSFKIKKIIAVGNTAHETLLKIGINSSKVRHPANGGKNEFIKGMEKEFE
ncbi:MAG TPA: uracil-DNA glycosylase [Dissulfurispiraceae bacterium]|nr:uracil-DNA glycosylase [Dissulfurispiraceae bacterium]